MAERGGIRRWAGRFREGISIAADLWDAVKLAAIGGGLLIAALVGTAVFALDVMPRGLLAVFVAGVAALSAGLLQPLMRKVIPAPEPKAQAAPPPSTKDPFVRSRELEQAYQGRAVKLRKAVRLIRKELLNNRHALELYLEGDADAVFRLASWVWVQQEDALLEHPDARAHTAGAEAYRRVVEIDRGLFVRTEEGRRRRNRPDLPVDSEVVGAIAAVDEALAELTRVDEDS